MNDKPNIQLALKQRDINFRLLPDGGVFLTHNVVGTNDAASITKQEVQQYQVVDKTGTVMKMLEQIMMQIESLAMSSLTQKQGETFEIDEDSAKRIAEQLGSN